MGAVRATKYLFPDFDAVTNNPARAVRATRCNCLNGALETVKRMPRSTDNDVKALVVLITAAFASCHNYTPPGLHRSGLRCLSRGESWQDLL
jgi:hypothetical protein